MVKDTKINGFGIESMDDNYFIIEINESINKIKVKEVFQIQYIDGDSVINNNIEKDVVSIEISQFPKTIQSEISKVFNKQLKESNLKRGSWGKDGKTYLNKFLGKELLVLFWAIENCDCLKDIKSIFNNWKMLKPTERWWLYTMISNESNFNSESISPTNWRKAIKIALSPSN